VSAYFKNVLGVVGADPYPAVISKCNLDGTYTIKFEDGGCVCVCKREREKRETVRASEKEREKRKERRARERKAKRDCEKTECMWVWTSVWFFVHMMSFDGRFELGGKRLSTWICHTHCQKLLLSSFLHVTLTGSREFSCCDFTR